MGKSKFKKHPTRYWQRRILVTILSLTLCMLFVQGTVFAGDMGGSPANGSGEGFWGGSVNWPTGTYGMNNSVEVSGGTVYYQWCSNGYDSVVASGYNVTRKSGSGSISWGSPSVNSDACVYSVSGTVGGIGSYTGELSASYEDDDYYYNWKQTGDISLAHAKPSKPTVTSLSNVYTSTTSVTLSANSTDNDGDTIRYHWYYSKNNGSWTDLGYTGYANSGTTANMTFSFTPVVNDFYKFYCYAECSNAQISNDSNQISFTVLNQNPNDPTEATAPSSAYNSTSISLSAKATDPDGHNVKFNWQYKKNSGSWTNISGSSPFVSSGSIATISWIPSPKPLPGDILYFRCEAEDSYSGKSSWSSEVSTTIGNRNPDIPVIDSSITQYTNSTAVSLVASANEPDDQKVQIFWQYKKTSDATWTDIDWTSQVNSDTNVTYNFTLPSVNGANYVFRCKAKDESGLESDTPTWAETNITLIDIKINEFTDRVTAKNNWITTQTENQKNNWYNIGSEVVEKVVIEDYLSVGYNKYDIEVDLDAPNPTNRNSQVQPNSKQVVAVYRIQGATKTQITVPAANIDITDATKVKIRLDSPSAGSKIEVYLKYKIIKTGQLTTALSTANKLLKNKVTVLGTKGSLTKSVNKDIDWILNVNEAKLKYQ